MNTVRCSIFFNIFLFALLVSTLFGCATTSQMGPVKIAPYVAQFNYTVASQSPLLNEITFTVTNPVYQTQNKIMWFSAPQFGNLRDALREDLPEILMSKGFNVLGPYDSDDLIPFPDKKKIDFVLGPKFKVAVTLKDHKAEVESIWTAPPVYDLTGNAEVKGEITLELREVITRELMWRKVIPFEKFTFPYFIRSPRTNEFKISYIMNDIARGVERQYPEIMAMLNTLIDPEEMKILQKQAQEIKHRQGY